MSTASPTIRATESCRCAVADTGRVRQSSYPEVDTPHQVHIVVIVYVRSPVSVIVSLLRLDELVALVHR
jgi:hypothetical protein